MNAGTRDTVNIDESVHDVYRQLTEGNDLVSSPFKTMKDVFLWAACLGYQRGERKPIIGKKLIIFRWAQFNAQIDIPTIKAISLSENGNIDVALNQEYMLSAIEEYANYGISYLRELSLDSYGKGLYGLVEIINFNEK